LEENVAVAEVVKSELNKGVPWDDAQVLLNKVKEDLHDKVSKRTALPVVA
jgi:hypothetical protein